MAIGKKIKDGIIIKSKSGFEYYHGQNDDGLQPLYNPTKTPGSGRKVSKIKTLKIFDVVEIANNQRFMLLKLAPTLFIKYLSEILKNETFVDIDPEKTNAENLRRIIIHSLDVDTLVNKVYKKFGFERTDSFGATGPWIIARVTTILKNCEAVV